MEYLKYLPIIFIGIAIIFAIYHIKKKGFKGAAFGGKIISSSNEIKLSSKNRLSGHIKVHTLENDGRRNIGIEIVQKSPLSYEMIALNFEREDISQLISELSKSIKTTEQSGVANRYPR